MRPTILPWCVVVVLLAAGIYLFAQSRRSEAELANLRPQSEQLRQVQAEKAELKRVESQLDELDRLRKDNEELHRLRNEVRQLREQQKQQAVVAGQPVQRPTGQSSGGSADTQRLQQQYQQLAAENERLRAENQAMIQHARTGEGAPLNSCVNNLRILEGAKEQWALENRKVVGTLVNASDVLPYLKGNVFPACSAGGVYSLNPVGALVTCSVPGHALPQQ